MPELSHKNTLSSRDFEQLFNKHRSAFVGIANSYVHDMQVAEDIATDSFTKLWETRNEIVTDNYVAYTFRIMVNKCIDYLKVSRARIEIQQDIHSCQNRMQMYEINSLESCNPEKLFGAEVSELIDDCLKRMPSLTRKVFIASRFQDKTYSETATELGLTVRQVTTHIQFALKMMRVALKDYAPFYLIFFL